MIKVEATLYRQAYLLSLFTIFYNLLEGVFSVFFGFENETLTLFGFGIDSFIEVISGVGIAIMILRIRNRPSSSKSETEISALKITGTSFYLLSGGLVIAAILNLINGHTPETTFSGVIISLISIFVMVWLMQSKKRIGIKLNSAAIIADSNCTKICVYMSVILLISSLIYQFTGFAYADLIGTIGLIYFSMSEAKEAFEKAKGKQCSCEKDCGI